MATKPETILLQGSELLKPLFSEHGFAFSPLGGGSGSGGQFACAEFRKADGGSSFISATVLGMVTYHLGSDSISHQEYMCSVLGKPGLSHYPGFSSDPLDAFRDLRDDLQTYCDEFLEGTSEGFLRRIEDARSASSNRPKLPEYSHRKLGSPGSRGIVLLLLYLAIDVHDRRPLLIDQPEENLDPRSVFRELVPHFHKANKRRQIIMVTHNANLVVHTDADQVIVASANGADGGGLPEFSYASGSIENPASFALREGFKAEQSRLPLQNLTEQRSTKMPHFQRYIGIDYSGAETADSSCNGIRVFMAEGSNEPTQVQPPPSRRRYWTRRGLAEWLREELDRESPTIVGIDHAFSFPLAYFEKYGLPSDWQGFLEDFHHHWPTDAPYTYVGFI